jgi:putative tricarboxylic transport membrane protein
MLLSQGELSILWSNPLVGSISTLALILLAWPLLSKIIARLRPAKSRDFVAEQPVD